MLGKSMLGIILKKCNLKKITATCVIEKIHKDNATTIRSSSFDSSDNVFLTVREVKKTTSKPKA